MFVLCACQPKSAGHAENGEKLTAMQMKAREEAKARETDQQMANEQSENETSTEVPAEILRD